MSEPISLIDLDSSLAENLCATIGHQADVLEPVDSPRHFFDRLTSSQTPRAVIVVPQAQGLDPTWFRDVRLRAPGAQLLVLARECPNEAWRRLVLAGAANVLCAPWAALDLEAELTAEPVISNLFRRHGALRDHGKALIRYRMPSDAELVMGVAHMVALMAMEFGFSSADYTMNLPLAVDEAVTNAIVHGNGRDHAKFVDVEGEIDARALRLTVQDEGRGFEPKKSAHRLDPDRLMSPGGRGLYLIESIMDEVRWRRDGTCIEMVKSRSAAARS